MRTHPARGRNAIIDRRGETMLGPEAIVDRNYRKPAGKRKLPADDVVGIEVTDYPAAAVKNTSAPRRSSPGAPR